MTPAGAPPSTASQPCPKERALNVAGRQTGGVVDVDKNIEGAAAEASDARHGFHVFSPGVPVANQGHTTQHARSNGCRQTTSQSFEEESSHAHGEDFYGKFEQCGDGLVEGKALQTDESCPAGSLNINPSLESSHPCSGAPLQLLPLCSQSGETCHEIQPGEASVATPHMEMGNAEAHQARSDVSERALFNLCNGDDSLSSAALLDFGTGSMAQDLSNQTGLSREAADVSSVCTFEQHRDGIGVGPGLATSALIDGKGHEPPPGFDVETKVGSTSTVSHDLDHKPQITLGEERIDSDVDCKRHGVQHTHSPRCSVGFEYRFCTRPDTQHGFAASLAPENSCSVQRLQLRRDFNIHEIHVLRMSQQHDRGGSSFLDHSRLRYLLRACNQGRAACEDDVQLVLALTRSGGNSCVYLDEAMFALKAWFAFRHMPKSVGVALTRYGVGGGPLPATSTLKQLLETINDSRPVTMEEAVSVRAVAAAMGASEDFASCRQMRAAVAAWYLNVQREKTDRLSLSGEAHRATLHRVEAGVGILHRSWVCGAPGVPSSRSSQDTFDTHALGVACLPLMLGVMLFLLSLVDIWIAWYSIRNACEQPLRELVFSAGAASLAVVVTLAFVRSGQTRNSSKVCAGAACAFHTCLMTVGMYSFLGSSLGMCGRALWLTSWLTFIAFPALFSFMFCCVPCWVYACAASFEFVDLDRADQELMDV